MTCEASYLANASWQCCNLFTTQPTSRQHYTAASLIKHTLSRVLQQHKTNIISHRSWQLSVEVDRK